MRFVITSFILLSTQLSFAQTSKNVSKDQLDSAMRLFSNTYIEIGGPYQGMWHSSVTDGTNGIKIDKVSQLAVVNGYCKLDTVTVTNSDRLGTLFYCIAK